MVTSADITVVIPSLPERTEWLERAVRSVERQSVQPAEIIVQIDEQRMGAYDARNKALARVGTPWVAFLDDDDFFHRDHLEVLIAGANRSGADLVGTYPEPDRPAALSLFSCRKGFRCLANLAPWGSEQLDHLDTRWSDKCSHCGTQTGSFILVTNLVRFDLVSEVGGFPKPKSMGECFAGHNAEDFLFLLKLKDANAQFYQVQRERTWTYHIK